jgi:hypothetical protein
MKQHMLTGTLETHGKHLLRPCICLILDHVLTSRWP